MKIFFYLIAFENKILMQSIIKFSFTTVCTAPINQY